jgi:tetratricopeptide (TPR) repeat protein
LHNSLGGVLLAAGQAPAALAAYATATSLNPQSAQAWVNRGLAAEAAGDLPAAQACLEEAVRLDPGSAKAWNALGGVLRAQNEDEAARQAFQMAVARAPGNAKAQINLGLSLLSEGQLAQARQAFQTARSLGADDPDLAIGEALALHEAGESQAALDSLWRATRAQPAHLPTHQTLNKLLWEHGETHRYATSYEAAIEAGHAAPALWLAYGRALLQGNRPADALSLMDRATRLGLADDLGQQTIRAQALDQLGELAAARTLLERIANASPGLAPPQSALARHYLRAGEPELAASAAERGVAANRLDQLAWAYLATAMTNWFSRWRSIRRRETRILQRSTHVCCQRS